MLSVAVFAYVDELGITVYKHAITNFANEMDVQISTNSHP
jgi:sRNA-binding regulator protein Hfq